MVWRIDTSTSSLCLKCARVCVWSLWLKIMIRAYGWKWCVMFILEVRCWSLWFEVCDWSLCLKSMIGVYDWSLHLKFVFEVFCLKLLLEVRVDNLSLKFVFEDWVWSLWFVLESHVWSLWLKCAFAFCVWYLPLRWKSMFDICVWS